MENPRSRALRSRRSSLIVLAVVATLVISGGAAYALGSGSASLTDPEAILDIARSKGLDVDEASITTRPLEAAQAVSGLNMTLVEYESSDGLCRDIVLSLGGQSGSVGYCAPAESSRASSLAEAVLSTGGLALDGTYLYIVDGHVAPDGHRMHSLPEPASKPIFSMVRLPPRRSWMMDASMWFLSSIRHRGPTKTQYRPTGALFHKTERSSRPASLSNLTEIRDLTMPARVQNPISNARPVTVQVTRGCQRKPASAI